MLSTFQRNQCHVFLRRLATGWKSKQWRKSELSVNARVVENGEIKNHFLSLLELWRGDAESIFKTVKAFVDIENLSMKKVRFSGMDGCLTMAGIYNGVWAYFEKVCGFLIYIHCRNHRLALCFMHLVPKYEHFVKFDSLLHNLFLLLENSNVKSNIFEEVQNAYGLKAYKLRKAVITRWLSHEGLLKEYLNITNHLLLLLTRSI